MIDVQPPIVDLKQMIQEDSEFSNSLKLEIQTMAQQI
jgi:hypothetical protein